jgi:hypothetical protein
MPSPRRFLPPWIVEERDDFFVVCDAGRQAIGYFYFGDDLWRRLLGKRLTRDEARVMAASFARLPDLLPRGSVRRPAPLRCQFSRRGAQAQRDDFSFHKAALHAVEFVKGKIAACWMRLDIGLQYSLTAFRAGVIDKQDQRHIECLLRWLSQ